MDGRFSTIPLSHPCGGWARFLFKVDPIAERGKVAVMLMEEAGGAGLLSFFSRRWRRQVPLGVLFWRDMIVVGSVLNLAFAFAGLMALGFKADPVVAIAVFHAPLPYNLFLFGAVWRTAEHVGPAQASTAKLGAVAWLIATMII